MCSVEEAWNGMQLLRKQLFFAAAKVLKKNSGVWGNNQQKKIRIVLRLKYRTDTFENPNYAPNIFGQNEISGDSDDTRY